SVWRREPKQEWKVVLDVGISHPVPANGVGSTTFTPGPVHDPAEAAPDSMSAGTLRMFDQMLSTSASTLNPARAVTYWTTPDRRGRRPATASALSHRAIAHAHARLRRALELRRPRRDRDGVSRTAARGGARGRRGRAGAAHPARADPEPAAQVRRRAHAARS